MKTNAPFTKQLLSYLIDEGYSHMYSVGIIPVQNEIEESENYLLIPLKPNDPRLQYQETDRIIEKIESPDVLEMAAGDDFIDFFVEMNMEEYDHYFLNNI